MLLALFTLMMMIPAQTYETEEVGVVDVNHAVLAEDGSLFILSDNGHHIKKFDENGKPGLTFGGKGQGPGEFNYATRIFYEAGLIYVWDVFETRFSVFRTDGSFVEWRKPPKRGVEIVRRKGGWAYGDWRSAVKSEPETPVSLFLSNDDFSDVKTAAHGKGNGYGAPFIASGNKSIYTPVHHVPSVEVSRDGEKVYLLSPLTLDVTIYGRDGKKTGELKKHMPRIPFNPDWANIRLGEVKLMYPERSYQTSYYPEFPVVRQFMASPGGDLVFRLWTFEPHKTDKTVAFREDGSPSNLNLSWPDWRRWLALDGDRVLVSKVDPETEDCTLVWIPRTELSRFLKAHPLPHDL